MVVILLDPELKSTQLVSELRSLICIIKGSLSPKLQTEKKKNDFQIWNLVMQIGRSWKLCASISIASKSNMAKKTKKKNHSN